jgi:hypothetical protein
MPYFVRVGAIRENESGVGSRGYQMFRRGKTIVVRFGPVEVHRSGNLQSHFFWARRPQEKTYRRSSEESAKRSLREMTREREHEYSKLPRGVRIR